MAQHPLCTVNAARKQCLPFFAVNDRGMSRYDLTGRDGLQLLHGGDIGVKIRDLRASGKESVTDDTVTTEKNAGVFLHQAHAAHGVAGDGDHAESRIIKSQHLAILQIAVRLHRLTHL